MKYKEEPHIKFLFLFVLPYMSFFVGIFAFPLLENLVGKQFAQMSMVIGVKFPFIELVPFIFPLVVLCISWTFLQIRKMKALGQQHNHPAVQEYFANRDKGGENGTVLHNNSH